MKQLLPSVSDGYHHSCRCEFRRYQNQAGSRTTIRSRRGVCLEQFGPKKTLMDDVARAAGMSRAPVNRCKVAEHACQGGKRNGPFRNQSKFFAKTKFLCGLSSTSYRGRCSGALGRNLGLPSQ